MKLQHTLVAFVILAGAQCVIAQGNVGIGASSPSEKLEVGGIIYTNDGGIRFPDMTLQQTAAFNSNGPEDAVTPRGKVYLTIESAFMTDTMDILAISDGGFTKAGGGQFLPAIFKAIKPVDEMTPVMMNIMAVGALITKARFHFLTAPPESALYHTIELRSALITSMKYQDVFVGNEMYAHMELLEFSFTACESKAIVPGPDPCFCWNFNTNNTCSCD